MAIAYDVIPYLERTDFDEIYQEAEEAIKDKMPTGLLSRGLNGAIIATGYAEILLHQAIRNLGPDHPVGYPDTAYHLPVITALSGEKVTRLGELPPILNRMRSNLKEERNFFNARLWGEATLYAAEIIEAIHYVYGDEPKVEPWTGFVTDPVLRQYGIKLVDWTIPGQAIIMGRAKSSKAIAKIVQDLMGKGFMIFLCDEVIEQLLEENMKMGVDYIAFPVGNFTQIIHAVNFALRAGLAFGGIPPGRREEVRDYQRRRIRAFVLQLGEATDVQVAAHFGANFLGFPVICDQPLEEEIPDWYLHHGDYDTLVQFAMEVRGIKLETMELDIPVNFGPAFEGEVIRKADAYLEFGGGRSPGFELLSSVPADAITDGKVELIGPDVTDVPEGSILPLGIMVDIYGRKMEEQFEGVLERRIHDYINYGEGLWHVAQRDLNWVRISKEAAAKGVRMEHLGEILIAKFKADFPSIVDRVQVTLITDGAVVEEKIKLAREKYRARDERMRGLTDEAVEEFYTCLLCQSFAPNHVCVVTPERVGLCGAVTWLDARASHQIDANGPNQPIIKGPATDEVKGLWDSVNQVVETASHGNLSEVALYTLMDNPMTSCGCFEAIMAIVPECNGIMITTREHQGETPCGMTFSTLAGMVGGGVQTPGFMGIGRSYILSRKFIKADGGIARIIWMPKELKDFLREDFVQRSIEEGLGEDFIDRIADETVGTTAEEIMPFLEEKGHPALTMDPLF